MGRSLFFKKRGVVMLFKLIALSASLSVQADNTVAYYRFGDDGWFYADSSWNGHRLYQAGWDPVAQADLVGAIPSVIPQTGFENNYTAQFAIGGGEVKVLKAYDAPEFHSDDFTVEAYVQPSVLSNQNIIASQWNAGSANDQAWRLMLRKANNDLLFQISADGITPQTVTLPMGAISQHTTYYVAASVDTDASGTQIKLYYQNLTAGGSLVSQTYQIASVTNVYDSTAPLLIGAHMAGGVLQTAERFGGNIDEFRWSNGALSGSQLLATSGIHFYVSSTGNNSWSGTSLSSPFQTVARAQQAVRQSVTNSVNDVYVWLRGGTYELEEPVVFTEEDGGLLGQTVFYQAWDDEEPVLCSDKGLSGWSVINSVSSLPEGCPAEAIGSLYWTDVSSIVSARSNLIASGKSILPHPRITELFDVEAGTKIPQSSTDGFEPETMYQTPAFLGGRRSYTFSYPDGILTNSVDITDAELHIVPSEDWTMNVLPLDEVVVSNRIARTALPGRYTLDDNKKWRLRPSAWIKNVPWGLSPGSWFFSGSELRIYYWSLDGAAPPANRFAASNGMLEYFRLEGNNKPVCGLVIKRLTFTRGSSYTWPDSNYIKNRWQHSWEGFDEASALLRFRGAEACRVEDCRFVNSGSTGMRLDLHCQDIRVAGCEFGHLGGSGLVLSGYGPGGADVNFGNIIENNWFHHGGERYWHSPGIFVVQSGNNYIARNLIHNFPYNGLVISGVRKFIRGSSWESQSLVDWYGFGYTALPSVGTTIDFPDTRSYLYARDNIVTGNEIFRVMDGNMGDGNAVYISGAGDDNVVSYNYVHDLRGDAASAMRTDDAQWNVLFEKNVLFNNTGLGIILKGDNSALNNYILNQQDCFFNSFSNTVYLSVRGGPNTNTVIERNMYVQMNDLHHPGFYDFITISSQDPIELENMTVNKNLYWWDGHQSEVGSYISFVRGEYGFDLTCRNNDPGFVDFANGDFRYTNSAPAALGIESLDVQECGLQEPFRSEVYHSPTGQVVITPASRVFDGTTNVTMSAASGVAIRYTLDGSEPTESSPVYTGSFQVTNPVVIRASQFGEGIVDRLDTRTILYPWTPAFEEDFELNVDGVSRSRMMLPSNRGVVTNSVFPTGGHAIEFNAGGQASGWTPDAAYQLTYVHGQVEISFDLWVENSNADLKIQTRDNEVLATNDVNYVGVHVNFVNSALTYNGVTTLTSVPSNQWIAVTITVDLDEYDYDITIQKQFQNPETFTDLPFRQSEFREFELLGFFISGSDSVYVDNMSIQKAED